MGNRQSPQRAIPICISPEGVNVFGLFVSHTSGIHYGVTLYKAFIQAELPVSLDHIVVLSTLPNTYDDYLEGALDVCLTMLGRKDDVLITYVTAFLVGLHPLEIEMFRRNQRASQCFGVFSMESVHVMPTSDSFQLSFQELPPSHSVDVV
jgi:hypothetical protein